MPRFFFHLNGVQPVEGEKGEEFPTIDEAEQHAWRVADDLARNASPSSKIGSAVILADDRGRELLRVCPESLGRIAKFSEHEADRCKAQERKRLAIKVLPILGEPAAAIEPSDGSFDDPAFG